MFSFAFEQKTMETDDLTPVFRRGAAEKHQTLGEPNLERPLLI
jgi:hypothetical protein